jgi:hypothetical protein
LRDGEPVYLDVRRQSFDVVALRQQIQIDAHQIRLCQIVVHVCRRDASGRREIGGNGVQILLGDLDGQ